MPLGRRLFWLAFFAALLIVVNPAHAFAQEMNDQQRAVLDAVTRWKVINTLLFAVGLGWAIWKFAPAFFNARSADIQKAIKDATGLKIDADFRYSEIDKKMANLPQAIRALEQQAEAEMEREHQRILRETDEELARIHGNVEAEIDAFRQEGTDRVRQHTAQVAIELAERRLRDRFSSGASGDPLQKDLLQDFIHLVDRGKN